MAPVAVLPATVAAAAVCAATLPLAVSAEVYRYSIPPLKSLTPILV